MDIKQLVFSFQGRVGRQTFWLWNLAYYGIIFLAIFLSNKLLPSYAHLLLPLILLAMLYPDLAVTAKRWHDRDKSSWWLLLNIPMFLGRIMVPLQDPSIENQVTTWQTIGSFSALFCGLWIFIECGFLAGSEESNRYGPATIA
ncbi:Uncharacterized membrane protein YhaH, DUF805 family [Vibrio xiamenensis]|uniref:Uncharacterized membrane protein YhaH, DUF805 family n=1 Tax=Vibrio xiamenensis TaxID=861298 RepID=A0A1G8BGN2_9VIBR|nr:DUF805 domain-containing protein [Vibrio xiamenensis]SDH32281.1 Uncharacterized membrane protein YhaH, DUF805 family [Vibrio xiamenensis]